MLSLLLSLSLLSGLAQGDVEFTSTPQTKSRALGETVVFECAVNTDKAALEWWFVTHNQKLSDHRKLLVDTDASYALVWPEDTNTELNLQISPITESTQGTYECRLSGETAVQTSTLTIDDVEQPVPPRPDQVPPANFTDCCVQEGMSDSCLPACHPSTLDEVPNFNPMVMCEADLPFLIKCGADNRNHVPCCHRRGVTSACMDWCLGVFPTNFDPSHFMCLQQAQSIVGCFEEGQVTIPEPPQFVHATPVSSSVINVSWKAGGGKAATGYKVFYREIGMTNFFSTIDTTQLMFRMYGLKVATEYELYVQAFSEHGSSLPSYWLTTKTMSDDKNETSPDDSESMKDCCKKQNMKEECVDYLCGGLVSSVSQEDMFGCIHELNKAFVCLGGQQDHTACCESRNVPEVCLPLCSGQLIEATLQTAGCTQYLPDINSCAQANKDTIPSSPTNLRLVDVEMEEAEFTWEKPSRNPELVQDYVVHLTERSTGNKKTYVTQGTSITVSQLRRGTMYEVSVVAEGAEGSSLPTFGIVFLTYQSDAPTRTTPSPPTEAPPHDIQSCCTESGVSAECQVFCSYTTDLEALPDALERAILCESDIGHVYKCAADGRNHSECCRRRGLPEMCLEYCAYGEDDAADFSLRFDHAICLEYLGEVQQCLTEGLEKIPSPPQSLYVSQVTTNSITVEWEVPASNFDIVTAYRVQYKEAGEMGKGEKSADLSERTYIVNALQPDTEYEVSVIAVSASGTSLPSTAVKMRTRPSEDDAATSPTVPIEVHTDLTECCKTKGVSDECVSMCSDSESRDVSLKKCGSHLGSLVGCAADAKDHSLCCDRLRVPANCHSFCRGEPEVSDFTGLLCVAYMEQILRCFREGADNLPYAPVNFHVLELLTRSLTVAWEDNPKNSGTIGYLLYYKKIYDSEYDYIQNAASPYTLPDLEPFTQYNIYVIAANVYGASLPSPMLTLWTAEESRPDVTLTVTPQRKYYPEFQNVTLACEAEGSPAPSVYWILPDQSRVEAATHTVKQVQRTDSGRYVCVADNGRQTHKDFHLRVQHALEVTVPETRIEVEPNRGLIAEMKCIFKGYPDDIEWRKGQSPFPPPDHSSIRISTNRLFNDALATVESVVTIHNVIAEDYGGYTCQGTNPYGDTSPTTIVLANPLDGSGRPTLPPISTVNNMTACCIEAGVARSCQAACSYDVDLEKITALPDPLACIEDVDKLIECGADGKNHSKCCSEKDVPEECLPYCSGIVSPSTDHLVCLTHLETIVGCMDEGRHVIPTTPLAVNAKLTTHGYIQVWWDPPASNAEYVTEYVIYYQTMSEDTMLNKSVTRQQRRVNLPHIRSHSLYTIYVIASNQYGQSAQSKSVQVETFELLPSAPRNLVGKFLDDERTLHLTWEAPAKNPGAVMQYIVYYSIAGKNKYSMETTKELYYDLKNLNPGQLYNVHVTAKTEHLETDKSNVLVEDVQTPVEVTTTGDIGKHEGKSSNKAGMAVGIVVALVVVFVVVGVGAWMYHKKRLSKPLNRFDESVAFENPGYTKPGEYAVTGLPEGNSEAASAGGNSKPPLPADNPSVMSGDDDPYSNIADADTGNVNIKIESHS